jgi:signal-transduction protein with cAMP-binding, CBS, and nucleotidyltransferase domain
MHIYSKAPITCSDMESIFVVTEAMASRRADAALLINSKGHLSGIITDNDITRRYIYIYIFMYMYIYIYICMCICFTNQF